VTRLFKAIPSSALLWWRLLHKTGQTGLVLNLCTLV
jgi:hypothetical protein